MPKTTDYKTLDRVKESVSTKQSYSRANIIGLVIGFIFFAVSLVVAHTHQLKGFQLTIFRDFNNLSNSYKTLALWLTEGLGAGYAIAACVIIPLILKRFKLAWRFFFTAGGAGAVMYIAKKIAREPRPAVLLHGHLHVRAIETGLDGYPSGHETIATALALTLWLILPKKWRWLAILWIIVVAISRIYVGDHTPNDIVGGFAIGLMAVCVVRLLPLKIAKQLHLDDEKLLDKGF